MNNLITAGRKVHDSGLKKIVKEELKDMHRYKIKYKILTSTSLLLLELKCYGIDLTGFGLK